MLVNHADSKPLGIFRGINGNLFSVDEYLPFVRLINTGEHIHQCGLTGTVFSQQCQNLTGFHVQLHIVVRNHTAKGFGKALQLDGILLRHGVLLLLSSRFITQKPETGNRHRFPLSRF